MSDIQEVEEEFDVCKKYSFIKGQVPKFQYNDPVGLKLIKEQTPVILTGSDLVSPAFKWNLDYLAEHIGPGPFAVFCHKKSTDSTSTTSSSSTSSTTCSCPQNNRNQQEIQHHSSNSNGDGTTSSKKSCEEGGEESVTKTKAPTSTRKQSPINVFKYYDEKKVLLLQDSSVFHKDIIRAEMTFGEFLVKYKGDRSKERVYLQQPLNNTVGRQIAADFVSFNWPDLMEKQKEFGWGPLTSNLLLLGQKGNITPCHYDEQQNLFCQLRGSKRFLLFAPDNFRCLYPYPVHHPHDRQSQVDLDNPDLDRFPKFSEAEALEAVITPGDVLYIPMYFWHHVINQEDTIAINFWHKAGSNDAEIEYPLRARQKVAIIRNIEKMLLEALQDQEELSNVLHCMVDGRF